MPNKIDANGVGLCIAVEQSLGVLPVTPVWTPYEPNSYTDFGSEFETVKRSPITASRQRRKGSITNEMAKAGFEVDLTKTNLIDLMPGFLFAAWRKKPEKTPSAVSSTLYTIASGGASFVTGGLLFAQGFAVAGNNGLKKVSANTGTTVSAPGLAAETPPATAKITLVGVEGASADITIDVTGGVASILSTVLDFTTLGLIPGEWIFIGGDATGEKFATAANNGWARIKTIAAHAIVLDRQPGTMVTDAGTGKTIRLFFGHVIKNESNPDLIVRTSYQTERDFQNSLDLEYQAGAVPNELELKVSVNDKVTATLNFMSLNTTYAAQKSGTRPSLGSEGPYSASSDFSRLRLLQEDTQATLATYMEEISVKVSNNCSYNNAIGTLGAFDITAGDFTVDAEVTAYFTDWTAAQAIAANKDVSLDFAICGSDNAGWVFDIPLVTLGKGMPDVAKDQAVKLPLSAEAAAHPTLNHTLMCVFFNYLPNAAE